MTHLIIGRQNCYQHDLENTDGVGPARASPRVFIENLSDSHRPIARAVLAFQLR